MTIFSKFQVCFKRCRAMHECDVSHIEITLSDFFVFAISSSSHMQKPYPRDTNLHNLILPKFAMSSYPSLTLNQFQPFAIKSLIKCTIPNMLSFLKRAPIASLPYVTQYSYMMYWIEYFYYPLAKRVNARYLYQLYIIMVKSISVFGRF